MAYEPHEWQVGDKITSARLNNMEQGIAASGSVVTLSIQKVDGKDKINASYDDIIGFLTDGKMVFIIDSINTPGCTTIMPIISYGIDSVSSVVQIDVLDAYHDGSLRNYVAPSRTAQLVEYTDSDVPK